MEGNILEPEFESFVGMFPIPMRHGMTVGELALMFNREFGIGCELEVVKMEGWLARCGMKLRSFPGDAFAKHPNG